MPETIRIETANAGAYAAASEADLHRLVMQLDAEHLYVVVHRDTAEKLFANDNVVNFSGACEWSTDGDQLVVTFPPLELVARGATEKEAKAALQLALEQVTQGSKDVALAYSAWASEHIVKRSQIRP